MRRTGVTARGLVSPIFKQGDDLAKTVAETVVSAAADEGFSVEDGDILGITESVVARRGIMPPAGRLPRTCAKKQAAKQWALCSRS